MKLEEFTIQVNESIVTDIMAHLQGRKLGDRKNLYNMIRAMKQKIGTLPEEQQQSASKLLDRFVKSLMHKEFANAKKEYDSLYSILRGV